MDSTTARQRPRALLVDMDGTLCDVRAIRHLVDGTNDTRRDFNAFHSQSIECPAYPSVLEVIKEARSSGLVTVIVSAREERWSFLTALWLREHEVEYSDMFLRANGDSRPDAAVKREIGARIMQHYDPVLALDDRTDLIAIWHEFGVPTRLVSVSGELGDLVTPLAEQ